MSDIQACILFVWVCFGVNVCKECICGEVGLKTRVGWVDGG